MATTHQILNNFSLSAPRTSPTLTISGSTTAVNYNLTIVCPLDTSDALTLLFERSSDGGNTWSTFDESDLSGGPIAKGVNQGQQSTQMVDGEIDNLNVGDKLRVQATTVTGTWVISASITQS